ncbi:MAG: hypothetical protein H7259_10410 [Cytophagales bacterium]|nr:hypothetical protein [Cytophaga sp.]
MSKEIVFEITLNGKTIHQCNSMSIQQAFNAHHTFELVLDQDALDDLGAHTLQHSQDYIGTDITISFGEHQSSDTIFKGIVTEVSLKQQEGAWGNLILKGYSPTCLMESGAHFASYEKQSLKDILNECIKNTTAGNIELSNHPVYTETIEYMCQYGESSFAFINRLAAEYGEWFFYDGTILCFGKPSKQEVVELVYGSNIASMNFSMQILPVKIDHYSYKSSDDAVLTASLPSDVNGAAAYTKKALEVSDGLYSIPVKQPIAIRIKDRSGLDAYAKMHKAKLAASTVLLKATGDCPKILLGNLINIHVSKKTDLGDDYHGEYIVTSLTHYLTGTGSYSNSFEAIPSANEVMPFEADKPIAQTQLAIVTDNDDPKGMGRVRVQMLWQQDTPQKTDWIRVLTPDAGSSDGVSKNRGQVFIPETGDQVLIGFRYNDPNRPFVLGSLFHGSTASGGGKQNEVKSMTTKMGSTLIFNDTEHSVKLQTSKGNTVHVDEKSGAITISSGSSVTINSKHININGSESISILSPSITIGSLGGDSPTNTVDVKGKAIAIEGENTAGVTSKVLTMEGTDEYTDKGGKYSSEMSEIKINGGSKIIMSSSDTDIS